MIMYRCKNEDCRAKYTVSKSMLIRGQNIYCPRCLEQIAEEDRLRFLKSAVIGELKS